MDMDVHQGDHGLMRGNCGLFYDTVQHYFEWHCKKVSILVFELYCEIFCISM